MTPRSVCPTVGLCSDPDVWLSRGGSHFNMSPLRCCTTETFRGAGGRLVDTAAGPKPDTHHSPVARGWKKGHTPPGGRTKRDLFYLKGTGVYFMKRMAVQKLSRYNN